MKKFFLINIAVVLLLMVCAAANATEFKDDAICIDFPDSTVIEPTKGMHYPGNAKSYSVHCNNPSFVCEIVRYHWGDSITISKKACLALSDVEWVEWLSAADSVSRLTVSDKPYDAACDYRFHLQDGIWYARCYRYITDNDITFMIFHNRLNNFDFAEPMASSFRQQLTIGEYITKGLILILISLFICMSIRMLSDASDEFYDRTIRNRIHYAFLIIQLLTFICAGIAYAADTFWNAAWPSEIKGYIFTGLGVTFIYTLYHYIELYRESPDPDTASDMASDAISDATDKLTGNGEDNITRHIDGAQF